MMNNSTIRKIKPESVVVRRRYLFRTRDIDDGIRYVSRGWYIGKAQREYANYASKLISFWVEELEWYVDLKDAVEIYELPRR